MRRIRGENRNGWVQRGVAVVELAVVSPLLLAMLFGIIEFGWVVTAQHTKDNAARAGARVGIPQGITVEEIEAQIVAVLEPMGLEDKVTIEVFEATFDDPYVRVQLTALRADVSLIGDFFGFAGGTLEGAAEMRKEGM